MRECVLESVCGRERGKYIDADIELEKEGMREGGMGGGADGGTEGRTEGGCLRKREGETDGLCQLWCVRACAPPARECACATCPTCASARVHMHAFEFFRNVFLDPHRMHVHDLSLSVCVIAHGCAMCIYLWHDLQSDHLVDDGVPGGHPLRLVRLRMFGKE